MVRAPVQGVELNKRPAGIRSASEEDMHMMISRRALLASAGVSLMAARLPALAADAPIRIGVINDLSGPYSDIAGKGSIEAVRLAIEDFGKDALGRPIEVLTADHQNKTDIGIAIAREWYDAKGVDLIVDVANSAIALGIQTLARERNKLVIFTSAASSDLTGKYCSPNGLSWGSDNWSNATALMRLLLQDKVDSFYFLTSDYAFGHSLESDSRAAIEAGGGKTLGSTKVPLNSSDFSSFLLTAQASGAKAVVLAMTGNDLSTALKQATEFGIAPGQHLATPNTYLSDVHALGLDVGKNLTFMQSWYWDLNDNSRAWSKRYFERMSRMPNDNHAALYSAVLHYLGGVKTAGSNEPAAVLKAMRATPISDMFAPKAVIREDGRVVYDRYLVRVKNPSESKGPWDLLHIVSKLDADKAYRPVADGGCSLVAKK
jgi:branched-chain amino acid transport system substrate-binding protein